MTTDYYSTRASAGRIALAVLATGGIIVVAYLVAALVVALLVGIVPTLALTGWFPWTIAFVQAVPLYAGAWLAGMLGTRIAAGAGMKRGWVRVATVMALPCLIAIGLAFTATREAWFATTVTIIVVAAGTFLGAIRRRA
jgi:hypothetical protein